MNLIYDLSSIGLCYKKSKFQTGVFRLADCLLKSIIKYHQNEINLQFSHCNYSNFIKYSKQYLKDNNFNFPFLTPYNFESFFYPITYRRFPSIKKTLETFGIYGNGYIPSQYLNKPNTVYFTPYYPIPNFLSKYKNIKKVITLHDIIYIHYPTDKYFSNMGKRIVNSLKNNIGVSVSEYTKNDICNYDKTIQPAQIKVVYFAASKELFYPCKNLQKFNEVQKKYNIPEQYFLSVCSLEKRKNLDFLILSFIQFIEQEKIADLKLVLVGSVNNYKHTIFESIPKKYLDKIVITGRVADVDLASIYSNAISFYFMSLYEGFGSPPLEAMQCGVPVVTSNTSSLPEVVGNGGILLSPTDKNALSQTMKELYFNSNLRKKYKESALLNAKRFSLEKTTKEYMEVFKNPV